MSAYVIICQHTSAYEAGATLGCCRGRAAMRYRMRRMRYSIRRGGADGRCACKEQGAYTTPHTLPHTSAHASSHRYCISTVDARSQRQSLYSCTSKASKLSTWRRGANGCQPSVLRGHILRCQRQLFGTSAAELCCSIRQHTSAYVSIRQRTSAYASIRQRMSAYVSICQHMSAYVSIRQHTSAYVSIRGR
jgi:hypothetical protein